MRKSTLALLFSLLIPALFGCRDAVVDEPVQREWRSVLQARKQMRDSDGPSREVARQVYVASLSQFRARFPDHERANLAYQEMELEYARHLAGQGRYEDAIPYYQSVLAQMPDSEEVRAELLEAERKRFVSADDLADLRRGMSASEVAERLGHPQPGWSRRLVRGDAVTDSWYYRRRDGGIAGVFFRNGSLFAAELDAPVRLDS